jgi:quinol monooxygenase YgiN
VSHKSNTLNKLIEVNELYYYLIKIAVRQYKTDEFIESIVPLFKKIRKEKDCLEINFYKNIEMANEFTLIAKWKTKKCMYEHYSRGNFEVLFGAIKVLGESLEMSVTEVLEKDGFAMMSRKITSQKRKSKSS